MSPHGSLGKTPAPVFDAFPRGRVFVWVPETAPELETLIYLPRSAPSPSRTLLSIHGIGRNAMEHALLFSAQAERRGAAVVAPVFSERRFRGYQTLRKRRQRPAPEEAFERMLAELSDLARLDLRRLALFGYSGGGQFAHRYALVRPQRVASLCVGAAGWYTWPDAGQDWPRGLADAPSRFGALDLEAFLRIPVRVFVGERDVERDESFNQKPELDARQGTDRLERGRRWVQAMGDAAISHGLPSRCDLQVLPGVGHSVADAVAHCALDRRIFDFHFGEDA